MELYADGWRDAGSAAELLLWLQPAVLRPLQQGRAPARQAQHRDQVRGGVGSTPGTLWWEYWSCGTPPCGSSRPSSRAGLLGPPRCRRNTGPLSNARQWTNLPFQGIYLYLCRNSNPHQQPLLATLARLHRRLTLDTDLYQFIVQRLILQNGSLSNSFLRSLT